MSMPVMYGERSPHQDQLFAGLSKFQGEIGNVERNADGQYGRYLDLAGLWEAVRPYLPGGGLCFTQLLVPYGQDGSMAIHSLLGHTSGQFVSSCFPLPAWETLDEFEATQQRVKRIVMAAMLGIAPLRDAAHDSEQVVEAQPAATATVVLAKYGAIAKRSLEDAEPEDRAAIHVRIHDHVAAGRIAPQTQSDLLSQFPIPKPRRQEVARA